MHFLQFSDFGVQWGFWAMTLAVGDSMHFLQFSDFGVQWGFWAMTLVPDMLEGQARAL